VSESGASFKLFETALTSVDLVWIVVGTYWLHRVSGEEIAGAPRSRLVVIDLIGTELIMLVLRKLGLLSLSVPSVLVPITRGPTRAVDSVDPQILRAELWVARIASTLITSVFNACIVHASRFSTAALFALVPSFLLAILIVSYRSVSISCVVVKFARRVVTNPLQLSALTVCPLLVVFLVALSVDQALIVAKVWVVNEAVVAIALQVL
jgi:hypothetical protein